MSLPAAPPSYAEATAGDKEHRAGNLNYASQPPPMPPPSMSMPMHPSWAYVHPGPSKSHCSAVWIWMQTVLLSAVDNFIAYFSVLCYVMYVCIYVRFSSQTVYSSRSRIFQCVRYGHVLALLRSQLQQ